MDAHGLFPSCGWPGLLSSCGVRASHCGGFSCCGAQALGALVWKLWLRRLVATRHVGSSQIRDWTGVPCIARWILNHCTTREASRKNLSSHFLTESRWSPFSQKNVCSSYKMLFVQCIKWWWKSKKGLKFLTARVLRWWDHVFFPCFPNYL